MSAAARARRVRSFAPVARTDARILILGTMPGAASLRAGQYYAHPHNHFWRLMGELYGAGAPLSYEQRLRRLTQHGIALWDVLRSCVRHGSLDAAIEVGSVAVNDLPAWLALHPGVRRLCCNGSLAHATLKRHFGRRLERAFGQIELVRLPSTSPANASWSYARKLAAWKQALQQPGRPFSCA